MKKEGRKKNHPVMNMNIGNWLPRSHSKCETKRWNGRRKAYKSTFNVLEAFMEMNLMIVMTKLAGSTNKTFYSLCSNWPTGPPERVGAVACPFWIKFTDALHKTERQRGGLKPTITFCGVSCFSKVFFPYLNLYRKYVGFGELINFYDCGSPF
jgi:hypothetical protein